MDLSSQINTVKSPSLRASLTASAPQTLPGAFALLMGALMQPLPSARPITDGLSAQLDGGIVSLHQRGDHVVLRRNGVAFATAHSLGELEDGFFDLLFSLPPEPLALAA